MTDFDKLLDESLNGKSREVILREDGLLKDLTKG